MLDLAAAMKADRYALPAAGRAAAGGGALRQAVACAPGSRSRPASPSSAGSRSSSTRQTTHFGRGETIADAAAVLSRYVARDRHAHLRRRAASRELADGSHGAGGQRAHRRLPPVPGAGRPADRARAPRRHRRADAWPTSATRPTTWPTPTCWPARRPACTCGSPGRPGIEPDPGDRGATPPRIAARTGGVVAVAARPDRGGRRRRRHRHRHLDLDGAGGRRARPGHAVPAVPGERGAAGAGRGRTRSCCTACRRTGARRSPTR